MLPLGKHLRLLLVLSTLFLCFTLIGCGSSGNYGNEFSINVAGYNLVYNGNIELKKVDLKTDDLDEIIGLYQEVGDNVGYRDSLLIAEKYDQGLGINAFAQGNLDTLEAQGLTLNNLKKSQIKLTNQSENKNAVLVEYEITKGFIDEIPVLYVSQLFIPEGNNIKLISFITEDSSSHSSAVKMFKNILQ